MKTLATIRSGLKPTIISQRKERKIIKLQENELEAIDDTLGLSLMYLSDGIEMMDGMYQLVSDLESTDDETREIVANLYDSIKNASQLIISKYSSME